MIVINTLKKALPTIKKYTHAELVDRARLAFRRHVPIGGDGKLQDLNPDEFARLRNYDGEKHLQRPPRWNGIDFPFAAYGEEGCAYDLPARVANFLIQKYNSGSSVVCEMEGDVILKAIAKEDLPEGVRPLRPTLDDPLMWTSESYAVGTPAGPVTISRGLAEPPAPYDPKDVAVLASAVLGTPAAAAAKKARAAVDADEPQLNRP